MRCVQASAEYLDGRIEEFLAAFRGTLAKTAAAAEAAADEPNAEAEGADEAEKAKEESLVQKFDDHKAALIAKKAEKPKTLGEESSRHWSQISNRTSVDPVEAPPRRPPLSSRHPLEPYIRRHAGSLTTDPKRVRVRSCHLSLHPSHEWQSDGVCGTAPNRSACVYAYAAIGTRCRYIFDQRARDAAVIADLTPQKARATRAARREPRTARALACAMVLRRAGGGRPRRQRQPPVRGGRAAR